MAGRNPIGGLGRALFGNVGKDVAAVSYTHLALPTDGDAVPSSGGLAEGDTVDQILHKSVSQEGGD